MPAPSVRTVDRPVRSFPPSVPDEAVVVAVPPIVPEPEASTWLTTVLPAASGLGIVGFAVVSGSRLYLLLGVGMAVLTIGAALGMRWASSRARRRRRTERRRRYASHLDERHAHLVELAARQRQGLEHRHPEPEAWTQLLHRRRLWERRPRDPDFLQLRLGRGRVAAASRPRVEAASPGVEEEPDLRQEAELLVALHACLDDAPLTVDLARVRSLGVAGPPATVHPLVRALLLDAALLHAPGELRLVLVDGPAARWFPWVLDLPHAELRPDAALGASELRGEAPPPGRFAHSSGRPSSASPERVLVVAGTTAGVAQPGLSHLLADPPDGVALVVAHDGQAAPVHLGAQADVQPDGSVEVRFADGSQILHVIRPDAVSDSAAQTVAGALSGLRPPVLPHDGGRNGPVLLDDLLAELTVGGEADERRSLVVPLGRDPQGRPVTLDLAEAAAGGDGPHGLLIGATGSGKSELMRTVLAGLAAGRSPAELAVVCWDFKGGAAVAPFVDLPHVRGMVTNLESDPRLVHRADRAIRAEMRRRQLLLRAAGVDTVDEYRRSGTPEAPPTLLLLVDEFSELLTVAPDVLDLFVTLGRLGRSLGIHLLLASQRLDEGRLRGLESHLRFRICLRTFSTADSHAVLGTDAAFRLPARPGAGLLSVDGRVRRFDGAVADDLAPRVAALRRRWADVAVSDAALWPPALPARLPLEDPARGSGGESARADVSTVTLGLVDRPDLQCHRPLTVDLDAGVLAVVGARRTGRSTLLATVAAALVAGSSPDEVAVYAVSDGDAVRGLAELPQVGAVVPEHDDERVRALVEMLAERMADRSSAGPAGRLAGWPQVVLLVDGWARFRQRHEQAATVVEDLAARGRAVGLHLVLTGHGWADFRTGMREHLATKLELRLADVFESEHGRAVAATLPAVPGRLLDPSGHEAQAGVAGRELLIALASRGGRPAPPVRLLPAVLRRDEMEPRPDGMPVLGRSADGSVVGVDLPGADHTVLVIGETGSGRTTTLAGLLAGLDVGSSRLWVVDRRRSLLGRVPASAAYAWSPEGTGLLLADLATELRDRLPDDCPAPGPDAPAARGAPTTRHVLVVDDYDLLPATGLGGALGPLADLLPHADEVGLSLVLARRGGTRFGFDAGWQFLLDSGPTTLLLSGDPGEGPVLPGVRAQRLPPGRGLLVRRGVLPRLVQVALPPDPSRQTSPNDEQLVVGVGTPAQRPSG